MQEGRQQGPESSAELNDFFLSASAPGHGTAIKVHGTPRQATPAFLLLAAPALPHHEAAQWVVPGSHGHESHRPLETAQEASEERLHKAVTEDAFGKTSQSLRGKGQVRQLSRERAALGGLSVNPWRCGFICRAIAGKGAGPCRALGRLHGTGLPLPIICPPAQAGRDKCTAPDSAEPHPPGQTTAL